MNEPSPQLPAERPPQAPKTALIASGGKPTAIIPHSVEEMFRIAEAIHRSGLAPASQNSREKVMVAIMAGAELGMPPWQSVQSFAVIGNRPSIWGDAIPALLWSNGFKLKEWFEGSPYDDDYTAHCLVIRPDGTEIPGEFSVRDAKEAGLWTKSGPWQTAKKRMLKMRARAFGARDGAADVLRGMQIREEVEDYVMGQPTLQRREGGGLRERLTSHAHQAETSGGFSADHVESELASEPIRDAEIEEVVDDADLDLPCEHCGAPAGVECAPDCAGAEKDETEDQQPEDLSGAAPEPETTAQDGAATAASQAGGEPVPAMAWAKAVAEDIAGNRFETVAEIDAFTSDPDAGRYFAELEAADPGAARKLNAQIKGKRKALLDRERA